LRDPRRQERSPRQSGCGVPSLGEFRPILWRRSPHAGEGSCLPLSGCAIEVSRQGLVRKTKGAEITGAHVPSTLVDRKDRRHGAARGWAEAVAASRTTPCAVLASYSKISVAEIGCSDTKSPARRVSTTGWRTAPVMAGWSGRWMDDRARRLKTSEPGSVVIVYRIKCSDIRTPP